MNNPAESENQNQTKGQTTYSGNGSSSSGGQSQNSQTGDSSVSPLMKLVDFPWILSRLQLVLMNPQTCWETLKREPIESGQLMKRFLIPLLAIPPMILFIRFAVFGFQIPIIGTTIRMPFFSSLIYFGVYFCASIASLYITAMVIEKLAPRFESTVDFQTAFMIVGYSASAAVLTMLLPLSPSTLIQLIGSVAGFYSLYLLYQGMTKLIATPEPRRLPFFAASLGVSIVASGLMFFLVDSIFRPSAPAFDFKQFDEQVDMNPQNIQKGLESLQKMFPKPE